MKLGIAQIHTVPGDLAHIPERVVACSRIAAERGCELLLFPLTTLGGPTSPPYAEARAFREDCHSALAAVASEVACSCAIPLMGLSGDFPSVELLVLEGGSLRVCGADWGAPPTGEGPERSAYPQDLMLLHEGTNILFVFSYEELDSLGGPDDHGGYDVVVFLSGYGFAVNDASSSLGAALVEGRYLEDVRAMRSWLVAVAPVGGYGSQVFSGSSFVLSPGGSVVSCAPAFEEAVIVTELDDPASLAAQALAPEPYDETYQLWQALATGLQDHVASSGARGVALVFDGSLAARTLSVLACDALGPTSVHLVLAAGDEGVVSQAKELAKTLRVQLRELGELADRGSGRDDGGRTDAALLASVCELAEREGLEILSTRDKTSLALGTPARWERLCDLAPVGDVYRSDLVAMLRLRNTITPVMGRVVLTASDVADLQNLLPCEEGPEAGLARVDSLLESHLEGERDFSRILREAGEEETGLVVALAERYGQRARDRYVSLPCLIASTCTVSEARLPWGFAWHDEARTRTRRDEEARGGGVVAAPVPQPPAGVVPRHASSYEGALKEALDLLRDISLGSGTDWHNPFSEN